MRERFSDRFQFQLLTCATITPMANWYHALLWLSTRLCKLCVKTDSSEVSFGDLDFNHADIWWHMIARCLLVIEKSCKSPRLTIKRAADNRSHHYKFQSRKISIWSAAAQNSHLRQINWSMSGANLPLLLNSKAFYNSTCTTSES